MTTPAPTPAAAATALLPCPFCGGTNLSVSTYEIQLGNCWGGAVRCVTCDCLGASPQGWHDEDAVRGEVVAAWNRRADASAIATQAAELGVLRKALADCQKQMARAEIVKAIARGLDAFDLEEMKVLLAFGRASDNARALLEAPRHGE